MDAATNGNAGAAEVADIGRRDVWILLLTTLVIATNGIIYELLIAGYSSYLLGDSIYQFSLTIGLYLSAMGVGSYLTRRVTQRLVDTFVLVELVIALAGGASVLLLSLAFAFTRSYELVMFSITVLIGLCIGVEIPLVTRIIAGYGPLRKVIANVLSYDYLGALVGSLAFPLVLLPELGFLRTALAIGLVNLAVAALNLLAFRGRIGRRLALWSGSLLVGVALSCGLIFAEALQTRAEEERYRGKVIYAEQSAYQRIVLTEREGHIMLTLNGHPQFSTRDEHRYHEAMVHPTMALAPSRENVLILGGGDGLALREIWKWPGVKRVTMVDLDPAMTRLAANDPRFVKWNQGSMADGRLTVRNQDAWKFLEENRDLFDVIIVDLPDPTNISLSKLYSVEFYTRLARRLSAGGMISVQSGEISPIRRRPFWCIAKSIGATGLHVRPYSVFMPSFGVYVWTLASNKPFDPARARMAVPTRFLTQESYPGMFQWDADLAEVPVEENRIDTHVLLKYFFDI
jgi:spermidine synthase